MTVGSQKPLKLFYSYAHEDKAMRNELDKHLKDLMRREGIESWYDGEITGGSEWEKEIAARLKTADIILLLVSRDFMASDYCNSVEMKTALTRHEVGAARVIPILLRPTYWKGALFSKLQILPTDANPVTKWQDRDDAFVEIAEGIDNAIKEWRVLLKSKTKEEWLKEGQLYSDRKLYEEALAAFDQAIRLGPGFASAHLERGSVLYKLGRYQDALADFDDASVFSLLPPHTDTHTFTLVSAYNGEGMSLHALGKNEQALASYDNALAVYDQTFVSNSDLALLHNNKGAALADLNRHEEAITAYDQAIRLDSNCALAYKNKGNALVKLGRGLEALPYHEKARQLGYKG